MHGFLTNSNLIEGRYTVDWGMDDATWHILIAEQRQSLAYRKDCSSETLGLLWKISERRQI